MTASRFRGSLAVWGVLLAYASLYPLFPMRLPSGAVVAEILSTRPVIRSDVAFNIVAYIPLGTLACLYFRQARPGPGAIARAALLGAAFSLAMETLQLFIPNRVASVVDLASNTAGAFLGALAFADPIHSMFTRPLGELRERMVIEGAWGDAALALLMLWLLAQLNPALPFFGAGDIGGAGAEALGIRPWLEVGMGICGFGLFVSTLMRSEQGSLRLTLVLLSLALWLKFAFASLILQPHFSADWVNGARALGLAGGLAAFVPLRRLPRLGRMYLAFVLVLAGALVSKIAGSYSPVDEFLRLFRWPHGQLGTFATLTRFIHELWPLAAVAYLVSLFVHSRHAAARKMDR